MRNVARPALEVLPSAAFVAERAAELIARYVRDDVARTGRATLAVSGGRTPQRIFEILAAADLPWDLVDLFQVDERIAPSGHADRNATQLEAAFAAARSRHPRAFHPMPVEDADLERGREALRRRRCARPRARRPSSARFTSASARTGIPLRSFRARRSPIRRRTTSRSPPSTWAGDE